MGRKALFFDIDGTLLSEVTGEVPESARYAVEEARKKGHLAFINSGRTYCLIEPFRRMLKLDGYCCGCGTRIIAEDKVLYSKSIDHQLGNKIKEKIRIHNLAGVLEGTESCYFQKEPYRIQAMEELRKSIDKGGNASPYGWDKDCYEYDKFCIMADEKSDTVGFFRSLGLDFDVIDRGNGFFECVPAGLSKATAIEMVLKHYGISVEDAYVFGDSTNDLPMFEYAKNAVLMGHHDVELEPYATFFTKNVEDDGIEYAMRKLHII